MNNLNSKQISTKFEVEILRRLRNKTTDGFSRFNGQISSSEQQKWWMNTRALGWLYWHKVNKSGVRVCVGFGVLRQTADGKWWNSIGVDPRFQGQGVGSFITHDLTNKISEPIYAAIRWTNTAAVNMHNVKDWERIEGPDKDLTYFKQKS